MATHQPLDHLRQEIDRIDDRMHDLLMRRTDVVAEIGALKRRSEAVPLALRPGREASILRRLLARHKGPFPAPVLVRIWREMLSAQVALQGDFTIAAFAPDGIDVYRELARDQFGSGTPLHKYPEAGRIVHDVRNGNVSVGILPMPAGERPDPWWRSLVADGKDVPHIIARLPFLEGPGEDDPPAAVAVAMIEPEATGDDVALVGIERVGDISRDRLLDDLGESGLEARALAACEDSHAPGHAMFLVSVEGYLAADEPRIQAFRARAGAAVGLVVVLGVYARPIAAARQ